MSSHSTGSIAEARPGTATGAKAVPVKGLVGFIAAWAVFFAVLYVMPLPEGMTPMGKKVLAVMLWAILIWMSEAMPAGAAGMAVPALLVVSGAEAKLGQALDGFSQGVTILALVAFIFSSFMQLAGLDRRIALTIVAKVRATTVGRMVWGMFIANFVVSFLIPGSIARQGALLPVVNGLVHLFGNTPEERAAKKALVIHALTYACLITGIVVQTAHMPNLIMTGLFAKDLNIHVSYVDWFVMQCPILLMFYFTYVWTGVIFKHQKLKVPGGLEMINREKEALGEMSRSEWTVLGLFALVALAWATEGWHGIQTPVVGLVFLSLFFMPGLFPFSWRAVQDKTIWGSWLMLAGGHVPVLGGVQLGAGGLHRRPGPARRGRAPLDGHPGDHDLRHARHPPGHLQQRGGHFHDRPGDAGHGPEAGPAPGALHPDRVQHRHLRLLHAHPDHGRGIAYSTGVFTFGDLPQGGHRGHDHRRGLGHPVHEPVVRPDGLPHLAALAALGDSRGRPPDPTGQGGRPSRTPRHRPRPRLAWLANPTSRRWP